MNRLLSLFRSVRTTAAIIGILILLYFLGLIIPQKALFQSEAQYTAWRDRNALNHTFDAIGFTDIYLSPVTVTALSLFFLNLLVVIVNRVPVILKRLRWEDPARQVNRDDVMNRGVRIVTSHPMTAGEVHARLRKILRRHRWKVRNDEAGGTMAAIRNRWSPLGFLFFHLSFFLCLAGGILIAYTRFSGNLVLTEGQSFSGDISQFRMIRREPRLFKALPDLALTLDKVGSSFDRDVASELAADLQVGYWGVSSRERLRVNEPVTRGATTILLLDMGVSPLFVVRAGSGDTVDGAYVALRVMRGDEDSFSFSNVRGVGFVVRFFPDYVVENGQETTRSLEVRNPAMHLVIEEQGRVAAAGTVRPGETLRFGGYTIAFEDLRFWAEFLITREYGMEILILGFLLGALGLVMRLVFYQKHLALVIAQDGSNSVIYLSGKSEFFPHLFREEVEALGRRVEEGFEKGW